MGIDSIEYKATVQIVISDHNHCTLRRQVVKKVLLDMFWKVPLLP